MFSKVEWEIVYFFSTSLIHFTASSLNILSKGAVNPKLKKESMHQQHSSTTQFY